MPVLGKARVVVSEDWILQSMQGYVVGVYTSQAEIREALHCVA